MVDLHLVIDSAGGRRSGLEQALRAAIRAGQLAPGTDLPSSRALAGDLGYSRATVVGAYEQLTAEGYLSSRQGARTTVAHIPQLGHPQSPPPPLPNRRTTFSFLPGEPDNSAFPRQAWMRSAKRTLADAPAEVFGYGDMQGYRPLRHALAQYLARSRAVSASPSAISIFPGFMGALAILCETFRARGIERIAIEDPSLFVCRDVIALSGLTLVAVGVDRDGLRIDELAAANVGAVVVSPAHQYPTGATMSPQRRAELIAWAAETGGWIIEDDYDGEFRYDRHPVGALQGLAPDQVIYTGTTSKSLGAGLRLAWAVIPPELRYEVAMTKHTRAAVSNLEQATLADFIERGELDRHVRHMRTTYRDRRLRLACRLQSDVPWLGVPDSAAGLQMMCSLPANVSEAQLLEAGRTFDVELIGLAPHWYGESTQQGLVLGFSRLPDHRFDEGVDRLVAALQSVERQSVERPD